MRAASDRMTGPSSASGASTVGHTYSLIRFQSSRASSRSADRAERRLSRQASRMRSSCGRPVIRPASSRTMVSSRTSARAMSRWSSGISRPWMRNRCTSGAAGSRVSSNPENRHTPSRSATSGCQPRWVRSSTACPSGPPRKVNQSGQPPPSPSGLRTATATRSTAGGMGPSLPRIRSARASGAPLPSSSAVWEVTYRSTSTVRPAGIAWISCGRSVAAALSAPSATVATIRYSCPSWVYSAVTSGRPLRSVTWTFRSDLIR